MKGDKNKPNLTWNVFRHNINKDEIYVYNIFDHGGFLKDVQKMLDSHTTYDNFKEELRVTAMYYFWCKAEHEIVITSFPPYISKNEFHRLAYKDFNIRANVNLECATKIDIFHQLSMNWDRFVDYVWKHRRIHSDAYEKLPPEVQKSIDEAVRILLGED